MADKLGVYVCSGCGIGDALDVEALCNVGTKDGKAAVCKSHAFLCGEEGAKSPLPNLHNCPPLTRPRKGDRLHQGGRRIDPACRGSIVQINRSHSAGPPPGRGLFQAGGPGAA